MAFEKEVAHIQKQRQPTNDKEYALIDRLKNEYYAAHCALLKHIVAKAPEELENYLRLMLGEANSPFTPGSIVERKEV